MKSTLFLIDAEEQLMSMKLGENEDSKTHLAKIKQHFELIMKNGFNIGRYTSKHTNNEFLTFIISTYYSNNHGS